MMIERREGLAGEGADGLAQQPECRLVIVVKERADGDVAQHHGGQHQHQQDAPAGEIALEQQGEQEADDHLYADGEDNDDGGRLQAVPDVFVGQNFGIVVEADELERRLLAIGAKVVETEPERPHQREDVHQEQQRDGRRHQQRSVIPAPGIDNGGHGAADAAAKLTQKATSIGRTSTETGTMMTAARSANRQFDQPGRNRFVICVGAAATDMEKGDLGRSYARAALPIQERRRESGLLLFDVSGLGQQLLLKGRDRIKRLLGRLLAGDGLVEFFLLLD
jgi:hypothetical protein